MFVNSQGKIVRKTPEEIEKAEFKKIARKQEKEALAIGWKVLANPDAKECVKNCLTKARK
jgi:histone H3/H4